MSKSLNNLITANDYLQKYGANSLRYIFYTSHYRQTINLEEGLIVRSLLFVKKLENLQRRIKLFFFLHKLTVPVLEEHFQQTKKGELILESLLNDLNTARVFFFLEQMMADLNKNLSSKSFSIKNKKELLFLTHDFFLILQLLGFQPLKLDYDCETKLLIANWQTLLGEKKFQLADRLREVLKEKKIF